MIAGRGSVLWGGPVAAAGVHRIAAADRPVAKPGEGRPDEELGHLLACREPHAPEIVASTSDARAIVLYLPAGERLREHEVHERAWLVVVEGEVEIESQEGAQLAGGVGLLTEFEPRERHQVRARSDARLLLLLTPWPGPGHPGALSVAD